MKNLKLKLQDNSYLDILFKDRNKSYGAYELRSNYNKRVFTGLLVIVLLGCISTLVADKGTKPDFPQAKPVTYVVTQLTMPKTPAKKALLDIKKVATNKALAGKTATQANKFIITDKNEPEEMKTNADVKLAAYNNTEVNLNAKAEVGTGGTDITSSTNITPTTDVTTSNSGGGTSTTTSVTREEQENEVIKAEMADQEPFFPGGNEALERYLLENLVYPQSAIEKEQEGNVRVQFVVDEKGNITNVEVLMKAYQEMNQEALRVVKKMPNWKPAIYKGKPVSCLFEMPIGFALEDNP